MFCYIVRWVAQFVDGQGMGWMAGIIQPSIQCVPGVLPLWVKQLDSDLHLVPLRMQKTLSFFYIFLHGVVLKHRGKFTLFCNISIANS